MNGGAPRDAMVAWTSWEDLRDELGRTRRYERAFTVVRVASAAAHANGNGRIHATPEHTAKSVASLLRAVDRVWTDGIDVYVLLPESDRPTAERLLARLDVQLARMLPAGASITLATFPGDARTSRALFQALHEAEAHMTLPVEEPAVHGISLVEGIVARTAASPAVEPLAEIGPDGAVLA
jgi:hypothetical protein